MLERRTLRDRDQDLKAVGSMIINLHDPTTLVAADMEDDLEDDTISESTLSDCALEFIEKTNKNTLTQLLKVRIKKEKKISMNTDDSGRLHAPSDPG
jgi:hypothetical protein